MAVINQLFANANKGARSPRHQSAPSASALPPPGPTPKPTVDSLFAAMGSPSGYLPANTAASVQPPAPPPATGLALLDSIFASASPSFPPAQVSPNMARGVPGPHVATGPAPGPGHMNAAFRFPQEGGPRSPPQTRAGPAILSPKPKQSGLPPLLYDDGSSRGSTPLSARSARGFGGGGPPLDEDAEERAASARPPPAVLSVEATPRPGATGLPPLQGSASVAGPSLLQQLFNAAAGAPAPSVEEKPVALADTSTLWLSDVSSTSRDSDDVLELDFTDTRALADASAFKSAQARAVKARKASGQRPPVHAQPATAAPPPVPAPPAPAPAPIPAAVALTPAPAPVPKPASIGSTPTSPAMSMMFVPTQVKQPAKAPPKPLNGLNGHAPRPSLSNGRSPNLLPNSPGLVANAVAVDGALDRDVARASILDALFAGGGGRRIPPGMDRDTFGVMLQRLLNVRLCLSPAGTEADTTAHTA
jgi:hypothetical protein